MKSGFIVISALIALWIAYVQPLWSVVRGGRLQRAVLVSWLALLLFFVFLCLILPSVVMWIDHDFGKEMFKSWVPEAPGVLGVAVIGWIPALMGGSIGLLFRLGLERLAPEVAERLRKA